MKKWEIVFLIWLGALGAVALCLCYLCVSIVVVDTLKMLSGQTVYSLSDCIIAIMGSLFSGVISIWIILFLWLKVSSGRERFLKEAQFPFHP